MPVDPLEEAREKLERIAAEYEERAERFATYNRNMNATGRKNQWDGRAEEEAELAKAVRFALAALDHRSPPTREGARTCVAVDDLSDQREAAWKGVRIGMDHRAAFDAGWIAARDALAAAPPPPDVSRGLDREGVARLIDPYAFRPEATLDHHDRAYRDKALAKADAIIALFAPAGGGLEVEQQYSSLRSAPHPALGGKPPLDEPERAAGLALATTTCFECGHDLEGPWCPACNPDMGGWRPASTAPRDSSWFLFYTAKFGRCSPAVRWREDRQRFEDKNDNSTGMNDLTGAWSHWIAIPAPAERDRSGNAPPSACTCMDVLGEDPNCTIHGDGTEWDKSFADAPADAGRGE